MFIFYYYEVLFSVKSRKQSRVPSLTPVYRLTWKQCIPGRLWCPLVNYFYNDYIYDDCFARSMKLGVSNKGVWASPKDRNVIKLVGTDIGSLISFRQFPKYTYFLIFFDLIPKTYYNTYILLHVLSCSIADRVFLRVKFSAILHNKTSNRIFIIQHAKLLCPCGRILRIFIYGECMKEVCEAERNFSLNFDSICCLRVERKLV